MTQPTITNQLAEGAEASTLARTVRRPRLLLLGGLLLLLLWLGLKTWRVVQLTQSLQAHEGAARALLADGPRQIELTQLEQLVLDVRQDTVQLQRETALFLPLAPYLDWLPRVGPLLGAAPDLMEMADAGTAAAVYGVRGLGPALPLLQDETRQGSLLPPLIAIIDQGQPDLVGAAVAVDRLVTARQRIGDHPELPWRVRHLLAQIDPLLPIAQDGLKFLPVLPSIMGRDGPRTYLIMAQNEDELRATGGFISGAGILLADDGAIVSLSFEDASLVVDFSKEFDYPPQPYIDFLGLDAFVFRDANYWPDFPTSARQAIELYTYTRDVHLDGVFAIDQRFLEMLVCVVGPLSVDDFPEKVTCDNVLAALQEAFSISENSPGGAAVAERKSFMGPLADAIRTKIESDPGDIDMMALGEMIEKAVAGKHLQLYVSDPAVAPVLADIGWDNALTNEAGQDLLLVVDTNVGYDKVNAVVARSLAYHVTLAADGSARADLTLQYQHKITSAEACDHGIPPYNSDLTYADLIFDCYWNYLRIYTPAGSRLIAADSHPAAADMFVTGRAWNGGAELVEDPSGLTVFGNFLLLPYGETLASRYRYELPPAVVRSLTGGERVYHLNIHRQAGSRPEPVKVQVTLPPGSQLLHTVPTATTVDGQLLTFQFTSERDRTLTVHYKR